MVFKDTKTRNHTLSMGDAGETRVLRQDFPVEVAGVLLVDAQILHSKPGRAQGINHKVINKLYRKIDTFRHEAG